MSLQFCTMDHLAELGVRKTVSVQAVRLLFLLEQALSAVQAHNGYEVALSLNGCVLLRTAGGKNRGGFACSTIGMIYLKDSYILGY